MATESRSESEGLSKALDWTKWIVVYVLIIGGIFGNWYFGEESLLLRALVLVALAVIAAFVILQTTRGRELLDVAREARTEVRRVVWPTRDETLQTTMIVLALILVFALILWGLDSLLSWIVQGFIG